MEESVSNCFVKTEGLIRNSYIYTEPEPEPEPVEHQLNNNGVPLVNNEVPLINPNQ